MLAGGYSWRLFFYVEFAFGCALLVLAFFVVEETLYHRKPRDELAVHESSSSQHDEKNSISNAAIEDVSATTNADAIPPRKTFLQTLKFWGVYDRDTEFFLMIARSFTYFLVPHVLWVITTYGKFSRTCFLAFPSLSLNPPLTSISWKASISVSAPSPSTTLSRSKSRRRPTTGRRRRRD